jgi:hypothetical protein
MSFETLVYGYINSIPWRKDDYRKYQRRNLELLNELPEKDEYPFLSRGMFSAPGFEPAEGTHRSHVIHFGGSYRNFEVDDDMLAWLAKFEGLLSTLYWIGATTHIVTEANGDYRFEWVAHIDVIHTYAADAPSPTIKWERKDTSGT